MKQFKIILTAVVLFATAGVSAAQVKIAHINSEELMSEYPKVKEVEAKLAEYRDAYVTQMKKLESKITKIRMDIQDSAEFYSEAYLELLQTEGQGYVQQYEALQQEYQDKIYQKQNELLTPVIKELKQIIIDVAKEMGYDYVLDSAEGGNVIYGNPSFDLMEAVKKRLAEMQAQEAAGQNSGTGGNGQ